ncbi:MAG TPA: ATP-binding protein [Thermoanaerobaculia bacterium]|nr:ATP-binding protein [Thermoanaerobaculia bacterium]
MTATAAPRRLGLRDTWVALPVALLLLVVLSIVTLLAYRNALDHLLDERRREALAVARQAAQELGQGPVDRGRLRQLAPGASRVALGDGEGNLLALVGEPLPAGITAPLGDRPLQQEVVVGPGGEMPAAVAAFVPLTRDGRSAVLRVDLPAASLAAQRQGMRLLSWVVVGADLAVAVWLLLFLRQLLSPYETLLARVRQLRGGEAPSLDEEAEFLLQTVERAVTAAGGDREELRVLERTLGPSLDSGLLLLDREGGVLAVNPAGLSLLAAPPPPPRIPIDSFLAPYPDLLVLLRTAVADARALQRQECVLDTSEGRRTLGLNLTPLRRADGGVLGFLVLFSDITESHRLAQELRLAESLSQLGELAAGVAHELRNGLATVAGYLTLLEREGAVEDYLQELRRETRHLERVVGDFLTFARPETARVEPVDLVALARRAASDPAAGEVEVAAERTHPAILPGDAQLLAQALRNLVRNAAEAQARAGAAGPVEVHAAWTDEGFAITVCDRGPGVPAALRERLFRPFATGRSDGVGLGLALAHRVVALHGGTLRLEDREGGGTCARMVFPLTPPA